MSDDAYTGEEPYSPDWGEQGLCIDEEEDEQEERENLDCRLRRMLQSGDTLPMDLRTLKPQVEGESVWKKDELRNEGRILTIDENSVKRLVGSKVTADLDEQG